MAANPLPIIALAAGAFLLLRSKDEVEEQKTKPPAKTKVTALPTEAEQVEEHKGEATSGETPERNPREPEDTETFNVIRAEDFADITEAITFRPTQAGDTLAIADFDDENSVYWLAGRLRDGQNNLLAELVKDDDENVLSLRSPQGAPPNLTIKLMKTDLATDSDTVLAYFGPRPSSLGEPIRPLVVMQVDLAEVQALPVGQRTALRPQGPKEAVKIEGFDGGQWAHWITDNTNGLATAVYQANPDPNQLEGTLYFIAETGDVDTDPITLRVLEKNQTGEGDVIAWM